MTGTRAALRGREITGMIAGNHSALVQRPSKIPRIGALRVASR